MESDVLYVLGRYSGEYSAGEIQMYTGRSRSQIKEVLFRLRDNQLLRCRRVEGIWWFQLNDAHELAQHIRAIAKLKALPGALHTLDAVNE